MDFAALSDDEVSRRLHEAAARERESLVRVLEVLGEFDRRKLHERHLPSCFEYCVKRLGYSEGASYKRIQAARAARAYPSILGLLADGQLSLAAVVAIGPHLNKDNYRALLKRACGKSKRELESLAASLSPGPRKRDVVRVVAAPLPMDLSAGASAWADPVSSGQRAGAASGAPAAPAAAAIKETRFRVAFDARDSWMKRCDRLAEVLRHKIPDGNLEEVLGQALEDSLTLRDPDLRRGSRRGRSDPKTRPRRSDPKSRRVPRRVQNEVWERDGGCCSFVSSDGARCGSRDFLQFDHVKPWALGGTSDDAKNIRLLCGPHNRRAAREAFGG